MIRVTQTPHREMKSKIWTKLKVTSVKIQLNKLLKKENKNSKEKTIYSELIIILSKFKIW